MNGRPEHPSWCSSTRCGVAAGGTHRSEPVSIRGGRGKAPTVMLMLVGGRTVRLEIVLISDLLINTATLDLDTGALLAATITKLIADAAPVG